MRRVFWLVALTAGCLEPTIEPGLPSPAPLPPAPVNPGADRVDASAADALARDSSSDLRPDAAARPDAAPALDATGDGPRASAVAMMVPYPGNKISGTGIYTIAGGQLAASIELRDCVPGAKYMVHPHGHDCTIRGGGSWSYAPGGNIMHKLTCAEDGTARVTYTGATTWSVQKDLIAPKRSLIVHPDTGVRTDEDARPACGQFK